MVRFWSMNLLPAYTCLPTIPVMIDYMIHEQLREHGKRYTRNDLYKMFNNESLTRPWLPGLRVETSTKVWEGVFDNYFTYWISVYSLVSECRLEWCTNGNDLNKTFRWEVGWSLRYCRICIVGGPRLPDKRVEYANTGKLLLFGFCFYVRLRRENCDLNTTSSGVLIPGGVHTLLPALRCPACLRRTTVH